MFRRVRCFGALALCLGLAACGGQQAAAPAGGQAAAGGAAPAAEKLELAYVTNGVDPFWDVAAAGVRAAEKEFNVSVEVIMPPKGLVDQTRMIEGLLAKGVDGIAISPIDAANQVSFINQMCEATKVITHDSDAPDSNRLCFIGMDNYKAGREAGKLVKEALPDGGKLMIFVGRLEQLNARQRRQGVIDEVLDRPLPTGAPTFDEQAAELTNGKYTIVGTRTDNFDYAKAKANAEDTIASNADLACMVGLFAYNIPSCLAAVKEAGKTGAIKLVSFDENADTLQGIRDGVVHGTVSQQPYYYGYESIRVLKELAAGNGAVVPENKFIEVGSVVVRKDNVEEFSAKLAEMQASGK